MFQDVHADISEHLGKGSYALRADGRDDLIAAFLSWGENVNLAIKKHNVR